jgi:hypothetical protein
MQTILRQVVRREDMIGIWVLIVQLSDAVGLGMVDWSM